MHLLSALLAAASLAGISTFALAGPSYTADGKLELPANYRDWTFLTAGIDMSYSAIAMSMGGSMFDNVFVDPAAYKHFQETGQWQDGTMLVIEMRDAQSKGSINKHGHFQSGPAMALEAHVKDSRFKTGWGFFEFSSNDPAPMVPEKEACYSCHQAHAAVDTTFVQFYPTLLPIAEKLDSLSPEFKRERAAE
ncbi:MAG TPA: cytochrome P460 family protein [Aliidongia sp.]|nr:cytochrome P460 family protein [Aliidongia sp.]